MLILAGVSINAIVGENGVLSKAQYSSFMNEMAAVEEAVELWKAGEIIDSKGEITTAIPANGLCNANELNATERLVGEIGYYRVWSIGETMPSTNILSSASDFNSAFESEMVFYPAGVQDLYYLNNEALGLKDNKVYLIDASTSIVYSMTGISLNGVRCYSSHMAKAVMGGGNTAPLFAEAEVSGTGSGEILAGNVNQKYIYDETEKKYVLNENYDEVKDANGFQIISCRTNDNIYKLYNNGDLYGKGVKGALLNTSAEEMEKINPYIWQEFTIPENIPGASTNDIEIYSGRNTIYVIDSDRYLWAWGNNSNNKLGLTQAQQVEYTGLEVVKLNVNNKRVKKLYIVGVNVTFVITEDNELYAAGYNGNGNLGLGYISSEVNEFTKIEIENVENIENIVASGEMTIISYKDNIFFAAGSNKWSMLSTGQNTEQLNYFTRIYDGNIGPDIDQDIKDILAGSSTMILKNDGTIWQVGYRGADSSGGGGDLSGSEKEFQQFPITFSTNVINIYQASPARLITRTNDDGDFEIWATPGTGNNVGLTNSETINSNKYWKVDIPEDLEKDGIKEIFSIGDNIYYLSNKDKVYVSGENSGSGLNISSGKINGIIYSGLSDIKTLYSTEIIKINNSSRIICFTGNDNKIYTIGNANIIFRENILQKSWVRIAQDVVYFNPQSPAYIDKNNDLYVAGNNSDYLGLNYEEGISINNFTEVIDSNIKGKAKKVMYDNLVLGVLTTDNELYSTGSYKTNGYYTYPGWSNITENQKTFCKVQDNVKDFSFNGNSRILLTTDNKIFGWGMWRGYTQNVNGNNLVESTSITSLINKILPEFRESFMIDEEGILYASGDNPKNLGAYIGMPSNTGDYKAFTGNVNGEKVKDIVSVLATTHIILTENGNLYGFGIKNKLGINSIETGLLLDVEKLPIENVSQITAGNGWCIAVKDDGTVWGTGSNQYGILGRWIGVDRDTPNSRYKTAFEWVECPELEI